MAENKKTDSMTNLLKSHNANFSAVKANKTLLALNILEEKERVSKANPDKIKKYKALTASGLKYGINKDNVNNPDETAPHYLLSEFSELLQMMENQLTQTLSM